jgi:hypothetical protein
MAIIGVPHVQRSLQESGRNSKWETIMESHPSKNEGLGARLRTNVAFPEIVRIESSQSQFLTAAARYLSTIS